MFGLRSESLQQGSEINFGRRWIKATSVESSQSLRDQLPARIERAVLKGMFAVHVYAKAQLMRASGRY